MRLVVLALATAACGHSPTGGEVGDAPQDTAAITTHGDAPVDAGPCGLRGGMRGKTNRTMTVAGLDRTYIDYLPANDDPSTPMPLVFVYHGYTMSGEIMYEITGYPALADSEHVALAFPDGQGGADSLDAPWNVGTNVCPTYFGVTPNATGDDFALLDAMKADIAQDQCIDADHVYLTGFSMGGYFAHHAGCMRPDIRAVAPHSGGTHTLDECPSPIKPILILHGDSDPVVPTGCDDPTATAVSGVVPSATAWAIHNGCASTTTSTTVDNGTCVSYDGWPDRWSGRALHVRLDGALLGRGPRHEPLRM